MKLRLLALVLVIGVVAAIAWGTRNFIKVSGEPIGQSIPTTKVKKGRVVISVAARGELQGGNSEMLVAPMVGNDTLAVTFLRDPGELVNTGDTVVEFDTTQQEYNLRESESD